MKKFIALLIALVLMIFSCAAVSAADKQPVSIACLVNSEGKNAETRPAVPIASGGECIVISGLSEPQNGEKAIIFVDIAAKKYVEMEYKSSLTWKPKEDISEYALEAGTCAPGNAVAVYYLSKETGELNAIEGEISEEYDQESNTAYISADFGDDFLVPAAVVTEEGKIAGVCLAEGTFSPFVKDGFASGSSGSSGSSGGSSGSGSGSSGGSNSGSGNSGGSSIFGDLGQGAIIGICAGVAAIIAIFIKERRKSRKTQTVNAQENATDDSVINNKTDAIDQMDIVDIHDIPDVNGSDSMKDTSAIFDDLHRGDADSYEIYAERGIMNGRVYPINKNDVDIGRSSSAAIRFPDDTKCVSRVHCKIFWHNGKLMLMDQGSKFGTYVKNKGKLAPMCPEPIDHGTVFYVGERNNKFIIK